MTRHEAAAYAIRIANIEIESQGSMSPSHARTLCRQHAAAIAELRANGYDRRGRRIEPTASKYRAATRKTTRRQSSPVA